ncbi:glycosyltransferase [Phycicoccus avicenniae]|uniref:glycosyltransferase n=1 Tax=Phycicoccus avicenniae TaxID=2828860 RepID=UPI003D26864A
MSQRPGVVVLAAYRPDPVLFTRQLVSVAEQTRTDFRCLVGADGGQAEVRRLVAEAVGDDPRFEVLGWDDNLGFYLNFERLLAAVPEDAGWVALCDQDDRWYPDKLDRLLPLLDDADLVTGQARVVSWPSGEVLLERTGRCVVEADDLLFQNQVTGAFTVVRRQLLDIALPFPRLHTVTQLHDHWLALCAVTTGRYTVLDEAVQDYVQHGGNQVGEIATHRGWTPARFLRRVIELGDTYEGGHSLVQCARACQVQSFEWRRLVLDTLRGRVGVLPESLEREWGRLAPAASAWAVGAQLWRATRSPDTSPWVVATFLPGIPYELFRRRRARPAAGRQTAGPTSSKVEPVTRTRQVGRSTSR